MTMRIAFLSMLLLPLMACAPKDAATSADAATTAPDASAAPADPVATPAADPAAATDVAADAPADAATTPASTDAAATPAPPAAPANDSLVAGKDYVEIPNGQPFDPRNGKIEVVEVFGFVCPACARFQPLVSAWKKKLPSDVRFTYVPAMFGGPWDDYAKAYYAAESMGLDEKTHDAMYKAIHIDESLKGERGKDSIEDIANFYGKFGADPKAFASTMSSFAVSGRTSKAKQFAMTSQISGTPSLVIDGKYLVKGGNSYEDVLKIADQLIARERAAGQ